jgi:hypothetical protein
MEKITSYLVNIATGSGALLIVEFISLSEIETIAKILCQIAIAGATIHTMLINQRKDKK